MPPGFKVLDSEPESLEKNSLFIYNDFSCIIFIPLAKVSINRMQESFTPFFHDKAKSYSLISIVLSLASYSGNEHLKLHLEESVSLVPMIKLKSNIISFLYSISHMNARTLMNKCNEAKALFTSESVQSSLESFKFSSASRKRRIRLPSDDSADPKSSQFSESFEYSLSVESQESIDDGLLSQSSIVIEEKAKKMKLPDSNIDLKFCQAETPDAQLKQFEIPSGKVKLICKLHDSGLNSTSPISVDGDKNQTYVTEYFQVKSPDHSGCCKCEKCVCF